MAWQASRKTNGATDARYIVVVLAQPRSVTVSAPASSANLGPGYDVLAAALGLRVTLTVSDADEFSIETSGESSRNDETNLCITAFERLHPKDRLQFAVHLEMPSTRGLGASGAAIVAGLVAADAYADKRLARREIYRLAAKLEGHADNVAAALYGGFVVCPPTTNGQSMAEPVAIAAPADLSAVLVIPRETLHTTDARKVMPDEIPLPDAVANLAATCQLVLGLERSDLNLIAASLSDRIHQPRRADLYRRSFDLVSSATDFGAIGATISGAGTSVLLWCASGTEDSVASAARPACEGWAEVLQTTIGSPGVRLNTSP